MCLGRSLGQVGREPFNCHSHLQFRFEGNSEQKWLSPCERGRLLSSGRMHRVCRISHMRRPAARRYVRCGGNGRRRPTTAWRRGQPSRVPDPTLADCVCARVRYWVSVHLHVRLVLVFTCPSSTYQGNRKQITMPGEFDHANTSLGHKT